MGKKKMTPELANLITRVGGDLAPLNKALRQADRDVLALGRRLTPRKNIKQVLARLDKAMRQAVIVNRRIGSLVRLITENVVG